MREIVKGDVFIIPNDSLRFGEFMPSTQDWQKQKLNRLAGINPSENDKMVEVWITSAKEDNWEHFGGFQKEMGLDWPVLAETDEERLLGYYPKYFPVKLFEGKKEGDTVSLNCPEYKVTVELTLNQLNYRYRKFGRFEDVLEYVS